MGRTGRAHRALVVALAALTIAVAWPATAHADPGDLDSMFGDCGRVGWPVSDAPTIRKVLVDSHGTTTFVGRDGSHGLFQWVGRIDAAGRLDPTFGNRGSVKLTLANIDPEIDGALAPDGGVFLSMNRLGQTLVVRLTSRGVRDSAFGQNGIANLGSGWSEHIVSLSDGRPVIALRLAGGTPALRRLNLDGTIDAGFAPDIAGLDFIDAIAARGTALLVGGSPSGGAGELRRLSVTGARDPGFTADYSGGRIDLLPNGKVVVVAGHETTWGGFTRGQIAARRLLANGAPDPAFGGSDGLAMNDQNANTFLTSSLVLPDGRVAFVGRRETFSPSTTTEIIELYTADGELDASFGTAGVAKLGFVPLPGVGFAQHSLIVGFKQAGDWIAVARIQADATRVGAGYIVDWSGGLWPVRRGNDPAPPCVFDGPSWEDDLARGVTSVVGRGGYVLDAYGGLHGFAAGGQRPAPPRAIGGPYWLGWDITRGVAALPNGKGGYVLDGWGGLHRFRTAGAALPPVMRGGPYWRGFDIARGVALMPDGRSGVVVDGYGGLHRFAAPGASLPPAVRGGPYWYGWDIVRGVSILPDGTGGYVLDGYGGVHPFAFGANVMPPKLGPGAPYFPGDDGARGLTFLPPRPA